MLMRRIFVFWMMLLAGAVPSMATHLVGGYIQYKYNGRSGNQVRYTVTMYVYRDCTSAVDFDTEITLCAFYENRNLYTDYKVRLFRQTKVNPVGNTSCPELAEACLMQGVYITNITLPVSTQGFFLKWERCCRNDQNNLPNGSDGRPFMGQTYSAYIPRTDVPNSSPIFQDVPVPFICANDTTTVRNRAVDEDGDSLVYRFVTPWQGADVNVPFPDNCEFTMNIPQNVVYRSGFNATFPFGTNGVAQIDRFNGLTTYMSRNTGRYAVALEVQEYRKGVLLSTTRLDLQILVINCRPNNKPRINSPASFTYTISPGKQWCLAISASDADVNDNLRLRGYGDMFTGANGFKGTLATLPDGFGKQSVSSTFCWKPDCEQARAEPYLFTVEVLDDGCPGKFINQNFVIYVKPFVSNVRINGPSAVCQESKGQRYSLSGQQSGTTFRWDIRGGIITGSNTGTSVIVDWGSADTGYLSVTEFSPEGCPGKTFTLPVFLSKAPPAFSITGPDVVCLNGNERYSLSPLPAGVTATTWNADSGVVSGISNSGNPVSFFVSWKRAGAGKLTVKVENNIKCYRWDTLDVDVRFPKTSPITGPLSVCPNNKGFIYSVVATSGSLYRWFITGGVQRSGGNSSEITVDWGNAGTGYVKVLETDLNGCVGDTVTLTVQKTYFLTGQTPTGTVQVCEYDSLVPYAVLPKPNTTFKWNTSGGIIRDGQGSERIRVNWGARGNGFVRMSEEGFDPVNMVPCLSKEIEVPVIINPVPGSAGINGAMEICQGTGSGILSVKGFPGSTYRWTVNGNTNLSGQGTPDLNFSYADSGRFLITVQEITAAGCQGPVNDTVLWVRPRPITSGIQGPDIICWPKLGPHQYQVSGFPGSRYQWFVEGGKPVAVSTNNNIAIIWDGTQYARIRVIETSIFGCTGDTINLDVFVDNPSIRLQRVTVTPPPMNDKAIQVFWELNNAPRYNNKFIIERRESGSGAPFLRVGTADVADRVFLDANVSPDLKAYDYRVLAVNLCGDTLVTSVHTTVLLSGKKLGPYQVDVQFTDYQGWPVSDYNLLRQLLEKTGYLPYAVFASPTRASYENGLEWFVQCYRVKADEDAGELQESWSNEICFDFDPTLFVPNSFTPNGDEVNDRFGVYAGSIKVFHMAIYDRWGAKLFETNDMKATWDGTYQGKPVPDGVYVVLVNYSDYKNREFSTKTSLSLLR